MCTYQKGVTPLVLNASQPATALPEYEADTPAMAKGANGETVKSFNEMSIASAILHHCDYCAALAEAEPRPTSSWRRRVRNRTGKNQ